VSDDKTSPKPAARDEWQDQSLNEFLARLQRESRMPGGSEAGVPTVQSGLQAIESDSEEALRAEPYGQRATVCQACGASAGTAGRFCAACGTPLHQAGGHAGVAASGTHHYHHHYHHHYLPEGGATRGTEARAAAPSSREPGLARAPLTGPAISRAETAVRKVTQDWALACNTRQLDDLVSLYIADGLVLRPNVPPVRGTSAIREFFFSVVDSGFGEVEMEPVRVELLGDVAYEAGRCKSLVPIAMGKRREERGKYLIVMARQANGDWRIATDSWSSDLNLGASPESAAKSAVPAPPPKRK